MGNWLFIPVVAVSDFALVVGSFFTPDVNQKEFIQNIALILIPIVTGGVAAKYASDSWQVTKEKLAIKRNILSEFEQSYKRLSLLCENFVDQVAESYLTYTQSLTNPLKEFQDYSNADKGIIAYLDFPNTNIYQKPPVKLKKQIEEFGFETRKASLTQNKLFSSLRLYNDDKSILEGIKDELEIKIRESHHIILRFIQSTDDVEFLDYYKKFKDTNEDIIKLLGKYEENLVKLNLVQVTF